MPKIKELHYFDRTNVKRNSAYLFNKNLTGKFARGVFMMLLKPKNTLWMTKYLFYERSDQNYKKLFNPENGQVSGEITPAYSRLPIKDVERIANLLPDCKIIYLLRNPVDRIWSAINMFKRRHDKKQTFSFEEIVELKGNQLLLNSHYLQNLANWEHFFPADQIFIGFFDELQTEPTKFLNKIIHFLNVDDLLIIPEEELKRPMNSGSHGKIPKEIELKYTQLLFNEIAGIHEKFNNDYTSQWLERAKNVLKN